MRSWPGRRLGWLDGGARVAPHVIALIALATVASILSFVRRGVGAEPEVIVWAAALAVSLATAGFAVRAAARAARDLHDLTTHFAGIHAGLPIIVLRIKVGRDGQQTRTVVGGHIPTLSGGGHDLLDPAGWERADDPGALAPADLLTVAAQDGGALSDYRVLATDGARYWLRVRLRMLARHADGSAELAAYVSHVTAEREATASWIASSRLSALGELAAGLAHELRQPLAAILMAAENAQSRLDQGDIGNARVKLARITQQAQRGGALIDHIRRLSRGGTEQLQDVALDTVLVGAREIVGGALRDAGIALSVDLGMPPLAVRCQTVALEQVFVNLLVNARDVLVGRPPDAPRRVHIAASPHAPGSVRITVADSGGGIAPGLLRRLFEPFVTSKDLSEGTGLGLAMCRRLVRGMGGDITVANGDEGAVFTIVLPAAAAPHDARAEPAGAVLTHQNRLPSLPDAVDITNARADSRISATASRSGPGDAR